MTLWTFLKNIQYQDRTSSLVVLWHMSIYANELDVNTRYKRTQKVRLKSVKSGGLLRFTVLQQNRLRMAFVDVKA